MRLSSYLAHFLTILLKWSKLRELNSRTIFVKSVFQREVVSKIEGILVFSLTFLFTRKQTANFFIWLTYKPCENLQRVMKIGMVGVHASCSNINILTVFKKKKTNQNNNIGSFPVWDRYLLTRTTFSCLFYYFMRD